MQSALILFSALILSEYITSTTSLTPLNSPQLINRKYLGSLSLILLLLIPSLIIHIISYRALTKQGLLLYEFNSGKFNMSLDKLDEISNDFPNLTQTAMPIKSMKARYFHNYGKKEQAYELIRGGMKDNPHIGFSESLLSQFYFNDKLYDSSFYYSKIAFDKIPNNMPHFSGYVQNLVQRKGRDEIINAFDKVLPLVPGSKVTAWSIFFQGMARISQAGDPYLLQKVNEAHKMYPNNENIFLYKRVFTYGSQNIELAKVSYKKENELYAEKKFNQAGEAFAKALDLDSLDLTFALNAGLAFYEAKDFEKQFAILKWARYLL